MPPKVYRYDPVMVLLVRLLEVFREELERVYAQYQALSPERATNEVEVMRGSHLKKLGGHYKRLQLQRENFGALCQSLIREHGGVERVGGNALGSNIA